MISTNMMRRWRPEHIPGCVAALDPAYGLPGGIVSGNALTTWSSLVPGAANAVGISGHEPKWVTGGLGGNPKVTFDGTQAFDWSALVLSGAKSVFCVFKVNTAPTSGTSQTIYSIKSTTGNKFSDYVNINIAGYTLVTFFDDLNTVMNASGHNTTLGTTNAHASVRTYNGGTNTTPGNYGETLDGTVKTIIASSTANRTSTDKGSIGGRVTSGNAISVGMIADLYYISVYNAVMNAGDAKRCLAWSRAKGIVP